MPTSGSMAPAAGACRGSGATRNLRRFLVGHRDSFPARGLLPASGALRPLSRGMSLWADFPSLAPIDDGPHRRIAGEPFGVVDVLGASETAVTAPGQHVSRVPAAPAVLLPPVRRRRTEPHAPWQRPQRRGLADGAGAGRCPLPRERRLRRYFRADAAFAMPEI